MPHTPHALRQAIIITHPKHTWLAALGRLQNPHTTHPILPAPNLITATTMACVLQGMATLPPLPCNLVPP